MLNARKTYWFLLLLLCGTVSAQQNPLRQVSLNAGDTVILDSLSVIPGSLILLQDGNRIEEGAYFFDPFRSRIFVPGPKSQEIQATFQVFPIAFQSPLYHKDPALLRKSISTQDPFKYKVAPADNSIFGSSQLERRGSISRGVTFGNAQNLSVNSNLNLQLSGRLSDNIRILASVSDENIPIQPEGNTQQLQDFDQAFIQLFDDKNKLVAGDFQQQQPKQSYFARYFKRAQGGQFSTLLKTDKNVPDSLSPFHKVSASAAVSRGKFSRNVIQGVEGNQGPYRLRGENGEAFIIVLSGTERVYIDGRLLKRGQEYDYVINYNTAELTFTVNEFITKDRRIIVEFQYSDRNFARSIVQVSDEYESKRSKVFVNLYSEQDSKNQSLQQELNDEQKDILRNIGDSLDDAIAPSIQTVEFDEDLILYRLVDTTINSVLYDSVFQYSTNPDSAFYRLIFSEVGPNLGNYRLAQSLANGKVYEWVPPLNEIPQGAYEPIVKLITPKVRRMLSAGLEQKIGMNSMLKIEGALSENDLNTFSSRDSRDDIGFAFKGELNGKVAELGKGDTLLGPWEFRALGGAEFWQSNFRAIERIRSVEFYRDWNLRDVALFGDQLIANAGFELRKKKRGFLNAQVSNFDAGADYRGLRGSLDGKYLNDNWDLSLVGSLLQTDGNISNSDFQRHKSLLKRKVGGLFVGYRDDFEWNRRRNPGSASLLTSSYQFWEREVFLTSPKDSKNRFKVSYLQRRDKAVQENNLRTSTFAEWYALELDLLQNRNHRFKTRNSYRQLSVFRPDITTQEEDNSLNSRIEYNATLLNGFIRSGTFVEVSSGLEARKEFSYIEVPTGQGVYAWIDYNDNGLQELDEFEIAQFSDQASFIKIFTPSDDYVKIFTNQFNQSLFLNPANLFTRKKSRKEKERKSGEDEKPKKEKKGRAKKFLSRFQDQLAYRIERKTEELPILERFNPLPIEIADGSLISMNSNFRNTLYFNRSNPKFGADIGCQDVRGRNLLVNGFEARENSFYLLNLRYNLKTEWMLTGKYSEGIKRNESEIFSSRNYRFNFVEYEPKLTYQPSPTFRAALLFNYREKANAADLGGELAVVRKSGFEIKYNFIGTGSLVANLNYVLITYNGDGQGALSFEMLEGLQSGANVTWSALYQRTLANNLQVNLQYNGRKTETGPYIHAGGVQLRAFF